MRHPHLTTLPPRRSGSRTCAQTVGLSDLRPGAATPAL